MPLSTGTRLGPYEILAPIGAGGMGEVYKARDTKLDREVAIKVLPPALARDPERLARFEREAKVLASLNHPNIAQIYGIEESSTSRALVMELVPGETLKGPLPLEAALNYAKQIAEALEAAHTGGITSKSNLQRLSGRKGERGSGTPTVATSCSEGREAYSGPAPMGAGLRRRPIQDSYGSPVAEFSHSQTTSEPSHFPAAPRQPDAEHHGPDHCGDDQIDFGWVQFHSVRYRGSFSIKHFVLVSF
jgi:hypothetical protein